MRTSAPLSSSRPLPGRWMGNLAIRPTQTQGPGVADQTRKKNAPVGREGEGAEKDRNEGGDVWEGEREREMERREVKGQGSRRGLH